MKESRVNSHCKKKEKFIGDQGLTESKKHSPDDLFRVLFNWLHMVFENISCLKSILSSADVILEVTLELKS